MFVRAENRLRTKRPAVSCLHSSCGSALPVDPEFGAEDMLSLASCRNSSAPDVWAGFFVTASRECVRMTFVTAWTRPSSLNYPPSTIGTRWENLLPGTETFSWYMPPDQLQRAMYRAQKVYPTLGAQKEKFWVHWSNYNTLHTGGRGWQRLPHYVPIALLPSLGQRIQWEMLNHGRGSGIRKGVF